MTRIPDLDQALAALAKANRVRSERARLRVELRRGKARIADLVRDPPECVANAIVRDLLLDVPKYGRVKVAKTFRARRVREHVTFAGLSSRERAALLEEFS